MWTNPLFWMLVVTGVVCLAVLIPFDLTVLGLAVVTAVAVVVAYAAMCGWVVSTIWNWFVVPLGLGHMSVPVAMGVTVLLNYLFRSDDKIDPKSLKSVARAASRPLLVLATAYAISLFR